MASLTGELRRRAAAARRGVDELRAEIARLAERLARAGERLSRLEVTRETVTEILGGPGTGEATAGREAGPAARAADPPLAGSRPAGARRSGW